MSRSARILLVGFGTTAFLICAVLTKRPAPAWSGTQLSGQADPPHVVFTVCENEYDAARTVPEFAAGLRKSLGYRTTVLLGNAERTHIPGLDALNHADLLVMFIRRATLPPEELNVFKAYFDRGGAVVAIRTSSHAFQNWLEFDRIVLGGNYHGHYPRSERPTRVYVLPDRAAHPILQGVPREFTSKGTLYKTSPLASDAHVLLMGKFLDNPPEPVAWVRTYKGGRIFYTSLGHPDDFQHAAFRRLLTNAIRWALGQLE